jgi:hypothetical protein
MQQKHKFPIYMQEHYPEIPASTRYPLEDVACNLTGGSLSERAGRGYFTSSVAFALALAIHLQYSRIELYGIEMESDTEYKYQRDGVFFWIGLALGRGIEVVVQPESNFFKEPVYGYEGDATLTRAHFQERVALLERIKGDAEASLERANKMQQEALEKSQAESNGVAGGGLAASSKAYFASIKAQTQAIIDLGMFEGALAEEARYLHKADEMDKAAGVHIFARQEFELTAAQNNDIKAQRQAHMNVLGGQAQAAWKSLQSGIEAGQDAEALNSLSLAYAQAHENYLKGAFEFGRISGIVQENATLLDKCDVLVKAAGGEKAEAAILAGLSVSKRNGRNRHRSKHGQPLVAAVKP